MRSMVEGGVAAYATVSFVALPLHHPALPDGPPPHEMGRSLGAQSACRVRPAFGFGMGRADDPAAADA